MSDDAIKQLFNATMSGGIKLYASGKRYFNNQILIDYYVCLYGRLQFCKFKQILSKNEKFIYNRLAAGTSRVKGFYPST